MGPNSVGNVKAQVSEAKQGEAIAGETAGVRFAAWLSADPLGVLTGTV